MWRPPALVVAAVLLAWSGSLIPSLLPRPWLLQGTISAIAILVGYGVGCLANSMAHPFRPLVPTRMARSLRLALVFLSTSLLGWTTALHYLWQSDVRRLMDIDDPVAGYLVGALGVAAAGGYVLMIGARLASRMWRALVALFARRTSRGRAKGLALAVLVVALTMTFDWMIAGRLVGAVDDAYMETTLGHDDDVSRPRVSSLAGGPGSLVQWDRIGLQGREFVASARTRTELEDFNGRDGLDPIRVYVGLGLADSAKERAALAVQELERAGGFERTAIVMIAPTGTGWIDPYAVDPIEFIFNGDTAAVATQYSHLPSWVLLLGNQDLAIESSQALFDAISGKLASLDEADRPLLLLYGESLGSFALEAMFSDLDEVREHTDGVLWVGPSRSNRLWQKTMAQRSDGSPVWRPVIGEGGAVRFGPDGGALKSVPGPWHAPRVVYLQHASDPITWLSADLILHRPDWLDEPRGPDVSRWMPYIPVVTFLQVLADLVMGTNAPVGHGHKFGTSQAEAWALIASPDTWTQTDTDRLRDRIEKDLGDER